MNSILINLFALIIVFSLLSLILKLLLKRKNKKQLDKVFIIIISILLFWVLSLILQIYFVNKLNANPIYFDYIAYSFCCFLPVAYFFLSQIYAKTRIKFSKKYMFLFIIPILTVILVWSNSSHHLFFEKYSTNLNDIIYGKFFFIYQTYSALLYAISLFTLIKYSIKNSGFFSKPAILILLSALVPIITNILGGYGIIEMSIYITPITFAFTSIFLSFAIFRFNILKNNPIALQTIVDRISDSFVILNEDYEITNYNETFIKTFKITNSQNFRGKHFATFLKNIGLKNDIDRFGKHFKKIDNSKKIEKLELKVPKINKTFNIEITSINSNGKFLGILILFKDISQHIEDMQSLKNNQDLLIEQERLASLGQMIGGIAHNLKTPIFSVAGGLEGLYDLIKEYDESIDDPNVTSKDMHDIAKEMNEWIQKLKDHVSYMSDVITTVKGQAVNMSEEQHIIFPISELFQHVNILMQHEIKKKLANLEIINNVPDDITVNGNINSLVQVINNLISNAIEAYGENNIEKKVILSSSYTSKSIIITVKDYGPGLPDIVKEKLFKEMITTKGKDGTGLGLFMSYSNIKAHFNGTIEYETTHNKGTTFNIIIPLKK